MISTPERYAEYRAFSREGFPAITALVSVVRPALEPLRRSERREFDAAKQFVGWAVGRITRDHGHKTVGRSRVPGGVFTVGAIWSAEPTSTPTESPLSIDLASIVCRRQSRLRRVSAVPAKPKIPPLCWQLLQVCNGSAFFWSGRVGFARGSNGRFEPLRRR